MKKEYITPKTASIEMKTHDNIAQFIISSHSVGEEEGLAKPGFLMKKKGKRLSALLDQALAGRKIKGGSISVITDIQ